MRSGATRPPRADIASGLFDQPNRTTLSVTLDKNVHHISRFSNVSTVMVSSPTCLTVPGPGSHWADEATPASEGHHLNPATKFGLARDSPQMLLHHHFREAQHSRDLDIGQAAVHLNEHLSFAGTKSAQSFLARGGDAGAEFLHQ